MRTDDTSKVEVDASSSTTKGACRTDRRPSFCESDQQAFAAYGVAAGASAGGASAAGASAAGTSAGASVAGASMAGASAAGASMAGASTGASAAGASAAGGAGASSFGRSYEQAAKPSDATKTIILHFFIVHSPLLNSSNNDDPDRHPPPSLRMGTQPALTESALLLTYVFSGCQGGSSDSVADELSTSKVRTSVFRGCNRPCAHWRQDKSLTHSPRSLYGCPRILQCVVSHTDPCALHMMGRAPPARSHSPWPPPAKSFEYTAVCRKKRRLFIFGRHFIPCCFVSQIFALPLPSGSGLGVEVDGSAGSPDRTAGAGDSKSVLQRTPV